MTSEPDRIVVQNRIDFVTGAVRRYVADVDALTRVAERARELLEGRRAEEVQAEPASGGVGGWANAGAHDRVAAGAAGPADADGVDDGPDAAGGR